MAKVHRQKTHTIWPLVLYIHWSLFMFIAVDEVGPRCTLFYGLLKGHQSQITLCENVKNCWTMAFTPHLNMELYKGPFNGLK